MPPKRQTPLAAVDPLADLRNPDDRYDGTQETPGATTAGTSDPGATVEPNALETVILARLEAAMAIPLDQDGIITADHRAMAHALATETAAELAPLVTQTAAVDVDETVARWHNDTVAWGFLHKGGRCGCHYIARVAFGA